MKRFSLAFLLVAAAMAAGTSGAHAATTLGETFVPGSCAEETYIQTADPGSRYTVPFDGVITSWSYQSDDTPPPMVRFKVGRVAPGADLSMDVEVTIVGQSALETPAPSSLNTFATRISVTPGDKIGEYTTDDCSRPDPAYTDHYCCEDVQPGTTDLFSHENFQQNISAVLEPDCDGDGLGDETQDPVLPLNEACGKGNRALTLDANKNKVKKRKKVTLAGRLTATARQGPCETAQTVELQRKRPSQTTFTTFAAVQTDAQGSFSLKEKVKKTFEYRAQAVETATCASGLSNTEKVKVKKKK